ncbi:MAG: FAD-binding protein [Deltaproteobacteria bacterium]|nr:FAD-binding protein [Deltaproteobacteria bacterium]MBW2136679.1 FAD-binding protein [Deltaproteobacteria bacterium]
MDVDHGTCDVLVIGSGMGGLRAAIESRRAGLSTLLVDKSILTRASASIYAGALVARKPPQYLVTLGVMEPGMDFEQPFDVSFRYFVKEGARTGGSQYTANQRLSLTVACEMELRAEELRDFGVEDIFSQRWLGPPGVYGKNIMLPLLEHAKKAGTKTREMTMITDLVRQGDSIVGAIGFDILRKCFLVIRAKSVVLATGSHGQIYERTYAPARMTGDGYAISYRAGATLSDMEMMGFDNWGVAEPGLPQYWIPGSSARVKGVLRNARGEPFFLEYAKEQGILGKDATLSLSDDISRRYGRPFIELVPHLVKASMREILEGRGDRGAVFLDLTGVPEERWYVDAKGIFTLNLLRGFDLKRKQLRVAPICIGDFKGGGVRIDQKGRTDLEGLFAAGDVSPGSSLLYALVTGVLAGRSAVNRALEASSPELDAGTKEWIEEKKGELETMLERGPAERVDPENVKAIVKSIMWESGGPLREKRGLEKGMEALKEIEEEALPLLYAKGSFRKLREAVEAANMVQVGKMILPAAFYRTESRGYNQRLDHPERDDRNWLKNTIIRRTSDGIAIETAPVEFLFMTPEDREEAK